MLGCGSPSNSTCGGEATAIEATPATWAGTTFMITLEASGGEPAGHVQTDPVRPGSSAGSPTAPGASSTVVAVSPSSAALTRRRRSMATSKAARTSGSSCSTAAASSAAGTRNSSGTTWSNRSDQCRRALTPRTATSSQMGRTTSTAAVHVELGPRHDGRVVELLAGGEPVTKIDHSSAPCESTEVAAGRPDKIPAAHDPGGECCSDHFASITPDGAAGLHQIHEAVDLDSRPVRGRASTPPTRARSSARSRVRWSSTTKAPARRTPPSTCTSPPDRRRSATG